jgi:catalase
VSARENFWDFIAHTPETTYMTTWLLSDSGILAIYRMIGGFGINTYKGINADGHAVYIKYRTVATKITGEEPAA